MIRINLLAADRAKPARFGSADLGQRVTLACGAILLLTAVIVGWRFWSLHASAAEVAQELGTANQELQRLQPVLESLAALERVQTELTARVELIERLRQDQSGPVRMLDQISRSLPDGLWLSALRETGEGVVVEGQARTLRALSDFVANLEGSGQVDPPVEIVNSHTQETAQGDIVTFQLRAGF